MYRYFPLSLILASLVISAAPLSAADMDLVLKAEQERIDAVAKASASTISVFAGAAGGGSGVIVSPDGYAVTNFHVAEPAGNFMKCSMPEDGGKVYDAVIVGIDPVGDVAVIKMLGRDDFPAAEIVDSNDVKAGDWCFAVGNPFLLATDLQPTVTWGIVSGVHRYQYPAGTLLEYTDCLQTNAAINPGNSGGPLFNAKGQLIGINGRGSFEKRGRVNVGVGYAISINQVMNFLGYLKSGRVIDHATLGATVTTDSEGRVVVTNILSSSDAYRRGLRYGDEIISFGNREITTVNGFKNILGIYPRGWSIPLSYRRDGKRYDTVVRLTGVHSRRELLEKIGSAPIPPSPEEKPEEEGDKPKKPQRPSPPPGHGKEEAKPPEQWKHLFAKKTGYANYHFNQEHQNRLRKALDALGKWGETSDSWEFEYSLVDNDTGVIHLDPATVQGKLAGVNHNIEITGDLTQKLEPAGSGGLFLALYTWKRLLREPFETFGEVYYLGTAPRRDFNVQYDVLVGLYDALEVRAYFDQKTGELAVLEMFPESDADPCEIEFSDYREVDGYTLPYRMVVRFGDEPFDIVTVKKWNVLPASEGT
ncbi:PDZ domain-containing protein [Bremerella cremea]|uniref:PDZ domain-containing protein n=1 Tax=Bremerella cremea TaxID=1031537 RepID=A0A368KXJ6_9BACT|nr:trypsin-like peptidase domain-containing protein [Bremerella cremea]RCS55951.1 PDZ domain-containing protein [Bremerella cremea]